MWPRFTIFTIILLPFSLLSIIILYKPYYLPILNNHTGSPSRNAAAQEPNIRHDTAIPSSTEPDIDLDIVISHYEEALYHTHMMLDSILSVPSIRGLSRRIFFYTKNEIYRNGTASIPKYMNATKVFYLENIGREGARHTLFIQADPHYPYRFFETLENYFFKDTGVLSLAPYRKCSCQQGCIIPEGRGTFPRVSEIYRQTHGRPCPRKPLLLTVAGQFVASRENIRMTSRKIYQNILYKLTHLIGVDEPVAPWFKAHGLQDKADSPMYGFSLEFSWMLMFHCNKPELARTCDFTRKDGELHRETCQCLRPQVRSADKQQHPLRNV
ncbi:hypothetical protein TWF694_008504 [Orbilia ellipsospora]|uniref:Uncharacterized protein n=1 Tax=Orbilia ellipsospora TaxID=2528407 RepID=A0AAV9XJQ6_9PEZI